MTWAYRVFTLNTRIEDLKAEQAVEEYLNKEGQKGWELVTATPIAGGHLLCIAKRPTTKPLV
jgi:hypothetical protein